MSGLHIEISGVVQGVGFRPWVYRVAAQNGVAGRVWNDSSGVKIDAFAADEALDEFVHVLKTSAPPAAEVRAVNVQSIPAEEVCGFEITASGEVTERVVSIPPDLATCEDCVREMFDPADRRYRYPFTNCTNCGPRFSIAFDVPYDRATTTMQSFAMCDDCAREYHSPADRRFHAQPNACPVCGPRLTAVRWSAGCQPAGPPAASRRDESDTSEEAGDAICIAADAIRNGEIVAIKGIGGFHLACDATSGKTVRLLRARKRRDEKPFAIMVRDLDAAHEVANISAEEAKLLQSTERPIVLLRKRESSRIVDDVAPHNRLIGVMLPYSPLHHLLLAEVGQPIVLTSGNLSEEPIAYQNAEAMERLRTVADLFLLHDRQIVTRCDDSVARVIDGARTLIRRSRGYVPRPVRLGRAVGQSILACGAHLKNTFALAAGDAVYLGPHIGDLENVETLRSYEESIERMKAFLGIAPEVIAYDLHPEYLATRYAGSLRDVRKVGVQHHHAHVAGVMAEHRIDQPAFGVAYDGTGYGCDGTSWGGEILLATLDSFARVATFRPIFLAGGDAAIRQVWRCALALLDDAFDGNPPLDALPLFGGIDAARIDIVRKMIGSRIQIAQAHGVGRYFDAFGALFLGRTDSRFEGQVAMEWNLIADETPRAPYIFDIDFETTPWEIDLRDTLRHAVHDFICGVDPAVISARFHATIGQATADVVMHASHFWDEHPIVLAGGCFQNELLTREVLMRLRSRPVYRNHDIPSGDGGIAVGQAIVADAMIRKESSACV